MELRKWWLLPAAAFALAGCARDDGLLGLDRSAGDGAELVAQANVECQVSVQSGSLSCSALLPTLGGASGALIGGQGEHLLMESSNVQYDAGTEVFSADVTVRNFLRQALGTVDGATIDPDGVRVFFVNDPRVTGGSGAVTVKNPDGAGDFSGTNQPYFQYSQIINPGGRSSTKNWQWDVPGSVESFTILVGVSAKLADEEELQPGAQIVATSITASSGHTCALDEAGKAYCWGRNSSGQIGDGTTDDRPLPVAVGTDLRFIDIAAGYLHTCAVSTDNDAYCWGSGGNGRLGNGASTAKHTPTLVSGGHSFASITATSSNTCGVTTTGEGYCWGYGTTGRNGDGVNAHQNVPVRVAGETEAYLFRNISAGHYHACGITTDNDAYCWGGNGFGRRGDGTTDGDSFRPVPVAGGHKFVTISTGTYSGCALTVDGDAYCWGTNGAIGADGVPASRLGTGTDNDTLLVPTPVVGGHKFTDITTGKDHTCGLTAAGDAYCWGYNNAGQRGDGSDIDNANSPQLVAGGHKFKAISGRFEHTCAITTAGAAYCWGPGDLGKLGNLAGINFVPSLISPITGPGL